MSFDPLLVLRTGVPRNYFCVCCGNIVYPDRTTNDQDTSEHLVCITCELYLKKCPDCNIPFTESVRESSLYEKIGKVFIRCVNHATQKNILQKRKVKAHKILESLPKKWPRVLEAMLRINGHNVKQLSWRHLYLDYIEEMQKPNACKESKVIILAKILKEKGMVELLSDGVPLVPEVRHKISDFKKFKMNTEDGVEAAIDHIHQHGPIVCVHVVTMYQRENKKSTGIIHGLANWKYHSGFEEDEDTLPSSQLPTHAVCAIGIGAEDLTPYLPYQNSAGEDVQNDGFGRILPSSVVEATGFIIDKGHERPSKRAKQTSQAGQSSTKGLH